MLDTKNLAQYNKEQIKGVLNNLKAGRRLYSIIAFIFILLTAAFGVASIVSLIIYYFEKQPIALYVCIAFVVLFIACLIVMMAMLITIKFKYSDPIATVEGFIASQEKQHVE